MSIKLTDTQLVLLGAAAQRKDLCLVAPPTLRGATAQRVAGKLISAGFVKEMKAKAGDPVWRRDEESGASYALKLTAAGANAIAVDDAAEPEDAGEENAALANRDQATILSKLDISAGFVKEVKAKASDPIWRRDEESGASYALKLTAAGAEAIVVDDAAEPDEDAGEESAALANRHQAAILSTLDATDARPAEAMEPGPLRPSAPRGGSKLALVIALLERDHGATIEELIAATGWLPHSTRAALTGLRKRGYAVAIDRSDDKRGSFYRIPAGEADLVEGPANSETARRKEQGRSEPQADQAA
jgi:Protein of unknown function (DUF3489)